MSTEDVNEAMKSLLHSDNEVDHCLAVGELLERLTWASGRRQKDIGKIAAALLLLWRGDHSSVEHVEKARQRARKALETADLDVKHLTMLATVGRCLLATAVELQGDILLATPEAAEYAPQENDLAIWLGKHTVQVRSVETNEVHDGTGKIGEITAVHVLTARGKRFAVSPAELELYWRQDRDPGAVESSPS